MAGLNIFIDNLHIYMLVFVRIAAIILLNPLFSRTNVLASVKLALVLGCTILIAPNLAVPNIDTDIVSYVLAIGKEFFVGFTLSYVFNIFFYMLMTAADIMDNQLGWSMAKIMNPQTNIQSGISGNILNLVFILYFFVTNSHLVLIKTAAYSYQLIPVGAGNIIIENMPGFIIALFTSVFSLALRLALPFIAAEFILEICMGILMKLIPQIHVFVIYMQGTILLGIILLLIMAGSITAFIDNYIVDMFKAMQNALLTFVT